MNFSAKIGRWFILKMSKNWIFCILSLKCYVKLLQNPKFTNYASWIFGQKFEIWNSVRIACKMRWWSNCDGQAQWLGNDFALPLMQVLNKTIRILLGFWFCRFHVTVFDPSETLSHMHSNVFQCLSLSTLWCPLDICFVYY